jgi:hypothetical protein
MVLPIWEGGFGVYMRYPVSNGWGVYMAVPLGLESRSDISVTPQSSTPHLFYETKIPLSIFHLDKITGSTIGLCPEVYSNGLGDDLYPSGVK